MTIVAFEAPITLVTSDGRRCEATISVGDKRGNVLAVRLDNGTPVAYFATEDVVAGLAIDASLSALDAYGVRRDELHRALADLGIRTDLPHREG
ncbi:hypothetical protein [Conexibacter woesei]|uniref:Uncharacterized protein n=1 Tax=Conexibacter woesei (strain DSM 14684 / CCUG 47730 / CIP 108061 / JCM 11494 / NBRC 100937 / ID131577) TaxID=469383 RepID=D3FEB6_CONWI|nr:hypothetical protein [Conexibacter woesei]ADB53608.1 hypothetical protein Cwoe_5200 [Conexibacter woesei DSM 14684]